MKKYIKSGFAAVATMFLFSIFAVSETKAQGQGILNEILKRMDAHQKSLSSLKSNVVMDKYNPQIDTHDVSEGVTQYVAVKGRDALVRIEWTKPEPSSLVVADGRYILYKPRIKQAYTGSSKGSKNTPSGPLSFMSMSKDQLRANYTVKYLGPETLSTGTQTWHLELTPKTPQSYKSAELWVDSDGMPVQAKVVENNNDVTTVLLSNLSKNQTIDGKVFKLTLPKDTTITKT
jgi:outer membrane lipoprotein-sorting protein